MGFSFEIGWVTSPEGMTDHPTCALKATYRMDCLYHIDSWPEVAGRSFRCEEKKITQAASISLENGMVTHLDKSPDAGTTIPNFLFQRNRHIRRAFPKSASLATY
ncbi:hypothetical protein AVEN_82238-1 [Araneus ventricosus]|uniref:Uncharacterized protein n=1 Tax=Araneus ventricosus TaxID=182803 RepID=A0A4Y2HYR3_ARAVE|nr:hypothetical protein AVEN_82238-1 [Araneus ventricosus]